MSNDSTNPTKHAEEIASIELTAALLMSGQSTLVEEDYEILDNALIKARERREAQSKKSRVMKYAYSIGLCDIDLKEIFDGIR